jgi:hypothetical protein
MNNNGLALTIERTEEVAAARPARHVSLRSVAQSLSKRNADAAICELLNQAICSALDLAYEVDDHGLINIDNITHKILFPLPWGRAGFVRWGLRQREADALRWIMLEYARAAGRGMAALFVYDRAGHAWRVNLVDYPDRAAAAAWARRHAVTVPILRAARAARVNA